MIQEQTVQDGNEKILVFTEHKDTLDYLTRKVREWGYTVCNIHGGMKLQDRIAAEKEFRRPRPSSWSRPTRRARASTSSSAA